MFQTKVVEKIKTHVVRSVTPPLPENYAVCEIMDKNTAEPDIPRMTVRCMGLGCSMSKNTDLLHGAESFIRS
jgi:hypothetical protein